MMKNKNRKVAEYLSAIFDEKREQQTNNSRKGEKTWLIILESDVIKSFLRQNLLTKEFQAGPVSKWQLKGSKNTEVVYFPEGNWTERLSNKLAFQEKPETVIIFYPIFLLKPEQADELDFFDQITEITGFLTINRGMKCVDRNDYNGSIDSLVKISVCQPNDSLQIFLADNGWNNFKQGKYITRNIKMLPELEKKSVMRLGIPSGFFNKVEKKIVKNPDCQTIYDQLMSTIG